MGTGVEIEDEVGERIGDEAGAMGSNKDGVRVENGLGAGWGWNWGWEWGWSWGSYRG